MNSSINNNQSFNALEKINQVDGFDPSIYAVEYTDFNTNETRKRLPVMIQMAWFRLKYPDGRIACDVKPGTHCFVAHARIYCHYQDLPEHFLSEATVSRGIAPDKPSVSPREWAQTAAIGTALRNAGFGLQFGAAGESFENNAVYELNTSDISLPPPEVELSGIKNEAIEIEQTSKVVTEEITENPVSPITPAEDALAVAMKMPCLIKAHAGKTLAEVARCDPNALDWIINKSRFSEEVKEAARLVVAFFAGQQPA